MRLDSIALSSVVSEIKEKILPGKIVDLYQLSKYELLFVIKKNDSIENLFFSIRPDRMAFFLSDFPFPSDNFNSLFFNQLKKWVQGGILLEVEHVRFDRIVKLIIRPYEKFGTPKQFQLIIEFMGKHSHVVLVDELKNIKSTLKQVGSDVNRYREIKPKMPYIEPPQQDKVNPLTITRKEFLEILDRNMHLGHLQYLWQFFQHHFIGFGSKGSKEIIAAMGFSVKQKLGQINKDRWSNLWQRFSQIQQNIKNNQLSPVVLLDKESNRDIDYSLLFPIKQQPNILLIPFLRTSKCLEFVFNHLREEDERQKLYHAIHKALKRNISRLEDKKCFFQKKKNEIESCEEYRKKGELIKANLYRMKPGTNTITLTDYSNYHPVPIAIPINPEFTPLENAQYYFKKYRKLQQNRDLIERQADKNAKVLGQLKGIQKKVTKDSDSIEELTAIYEKLVRLGIIKKEKTSSLIRKNVKKPTISKFLSTDGWTILVGKNSKQNEYILRHLSSGNDFWLHSLSKPGGHVIIKNHRNLKHPPYPTLLFAARLAGYYSKAKDKEPVQIVYTMRKYVRKPKNAKIGKVVYTNEKTIPVEVNHSEIKKEMNHMRVH